MVDFRKLFEKEAEEDAALKNYVAQLPVYGVDPETGFTNYTNPVIPQLRLPVQGIHDQPYIPTQADLGGPVQFMPSVQQGIANVKDIYQHGFDTPENLSAKVFGPMEGGASDVPERYQTWPEKMVRSGTTLANDVMAGRVYSDPGMRATDYSDIPGAPEPLANLIERTQDMAGLAAGGSVAATGLKAEKPGMLARGASNLKDRLHQFLAEDDIAGTAVTSLADRLHEHLNERPNVSNEYKGESMPEILARQRASEGYEAAIRDPETKKLYTGMWHEEVLDKIAKDRGVPKAYLPDNLIKGYINDRGRFLTEEAVEKLSQNKSKSKTAMFRSDDEAGTAIAGLRQPTNLTREQLERMNINDLDRMAYGHAQEDKLTLNPDKINIKYKDDLVNPEDKFAKKGISWVNSVKFDEPVKVSIGQDGKFYLEDGHHRYFAAKKLGKPLNAVIEKIDGKPIETILKDGVLRSDDIVGTGLAAAAPRFYSHVENIAKAAPEKMTANEWKAYLKNKGATKEELEALRVHDLLGEDVERSGASAAQGTPAQDALNEWRKTNKGKPPDDLLKASRAEVEARVKAGTVKDESPVINREDLINHLNENKVELNEKWLGGDDKRKNGEQFNDYLNSVPNPKPRFAQWQLPGGPLSKDTELLTRYGWKRIDTISVNDIIMTRKDEDGSLEWQPVLDVPIVYAEKLYHFFNQSVDMQVTENHKMVVKRRRRNSKGIFRVTAKQLWSMSECQIPLTGVWKGQGTREIFGMNAVDVAEFIGWYIAEGSYKKNASGAKNTIQIAQSRSVNPEKCDRLEDLFDSLSLDWKYYGDDAYGISSKSMNDDLLNLLHNQPMAEGKFIPKFFFNQSKEVIEALLEGLILGDGHTTEEGFDKYGSYKQSVRMFFSKSKQLADDVQVLVLLSGYRATVRRRPSGIYSVGISLRDWNDVDSSKYAIVDYNDYAYCVTVENHCIYVRRNGVAAFTGNTNYRELLLSTKDNPKKLERIKEINKLGAELEKQRSNVNSKDELNKITEKQHALIGELQDLQHSFTHDHWPGQKDVVVHSRMNDRFIPDEGGPSVENGKKGFNSSHDEEIQSDWLQQGNSEGFKLSAKDKAKLEPEFNRIEEKIVNSGDEQVMSSPEIKDAVKLAVDKKIITEAEAKTYLRYADSERYNAVKDAPFKSSWPDLMIKRRLRQAVEEGKDSYSWTPGQAQIDRYPGLQKSIKSFHYDKNTGKLTGYGHNGSVDIAETNIKENDLHKHVGGEEIAKKLLESKENSDNLKIRRIVNDDGKYGDYEVVNMVSGKILKTNFKTKESANEWMKNNENNLINNNYYLENANVKVGGEFHKKFYDEIMVNKVNAIAKKYGARVEEKNIPQNTNKLHIKQEDYGIGESKWVIKNHDNNFQNLFSFDNEAAAKAKLEELKNQKVWFLKFTPELKKAALERGFSLFETGFPLTPIDHDPFKSENKKYKLTPITGNPFK